jgi:hypothetical protein
VRLSDAEEAVDVALRDAVEKARVLLGSQGFAGPQPATRDLRQAIELLDLAEVELERARDAEPHLRRSR